MTDGDVHERMARWMRRALDAEQERDLLRVVAAAAHELLDADRLSWTDYHAALDAALAALEPKAEVTDG
jgi:hypothetical protein